MRAVADWCVYIAVRLVVCLIQAIDLRHFRSAADAFAWLAYDVLRIRRRITDENLAHAFPALEPAEREQIALGMWRHLALMVCEVVQAPRKINGTNWRRFISIPDKDRIVRMLLERRSHVLVSGHLGNFEIGGIASGLLGFPTYTVARTLDNPYLDTFLNQFRQATGQFMLPKQGSAGQVDAVLAAGRTVVLLCDQSAGPKGCFVEFFQRLASCHKAVALFPLISKAPLSLVYTRRVDGPLRFEVGLVDQLDPLRDPDDPRLADVRTVTQWYSDKLADAIHETPDQYWWLHDRWKDQPRKKPSPRAKRAA